MIKERYYYAVATFIRKDDKLTYTSVTSSVKGEEKDIKFYPLMDLITDVEEKFKDDGTLENTLEVNIRAEWNRDKNMAEGEIFAALFSALRGVLHKYGQYDARKFPKEKSIAKTAADNPCAFFDMLNEFQKKYKGKKENHKEDGKVDKGNG